jgi:hypothetical protein
MLLEERDGVINFKTMGKLIINSIYHILILHIFLVHVLSSVYNKLIKKLQIYKILYPSLIIIEETYND